MNRLALFVAAFVCVAAGVVYALTTPATRSTGAVGADYAALHERIDALERSLNEEREARQLLETELFALIDAADSNPSERSARDRGAEPEVDPAASTRTLRPRRFGSNPLSSVELSERLQANGMSPDRADFLARRQSELNLESMQTMWEARRSGDTGVFQTMIDAQRALRDEMTEVEYEQYLTATDRPTAVSVGSVMEFSPAADAGLQAGDRIVRYDGERVYNIGDLYQRQVAVTGDRNVIIDIERNGTPMQISMPPGPLGIVGRRRR